MHHLHNPDVHGGRTFVKRSFSLLDRHEAQYITSDSGNAPSYNDLQSSSAWVSNVGQHNREPEFIETDFSTPLTEIARPHSLNANEDILSSEFGNQSNINKRPYSANQISEETMLNKSSNIMNPSMNYSTSQGIERPKFSIDKHISKSSYSRGRSIDTVPTFIKAHNNSSYMKMPISQKSSPIKPNSFATQNYNQKYISLLPKTTAPPKTTVKIVNPYAISQAQSIKMVSSIGSHIVPGSASFITNTSRDFPRFAPYSSPCYNTQRDHAPINSSMHASPLNLSFKNNPREVKGSQINSMNTTKEITSKNQDFSAPLNLIYKAKQKDLPTDLSLQNKPSKKFETSESCSSSCLDKNTLKSETSSTIMAASVSPLMPSNESASISVSSKELPIDKDLCQNKESAQQTSVILPIKISKSNLINSQDISIKEEVSSCKSQQDNDDEMLEQESDDSKFSWDDYLEHCGSVAAPSDLFRHVECSLQNGLKKGMVVEVANKDPAGTFWVASIIMSCGQLLMLRPACCQTGSSLDFWCDMSTYELHPIGWCSTNHKQICPPKDLVDKVLPNWESALKELLMQAITPPTCMLDQKAGSLPFDLINVDMIYEVQHEVEPEVSWFARVVENVGGRLLLQYEGSSEMFWLFYTNNRLHPLGFSSKQNKKLIPPVEILKDKSEKEWKELKAKCMDEAETNGPPEEVFKDQEPLEKHNFKEGWRLELFDTNYSALRVAHISRVVDEFYFIVEPDNTSDEKFCCLQDSSVIFPIGWHKEHDIKLLPVAGYDRGLEFDLLAYLETESLEAAPIELFDQANTILSEFEKGMKLEATDPRQPDEICATTLVDMKGPLMWLKLDHDDSFTMVVPHDSHEIFPIGWCESNNYQLKTPFYKSNNNNNHDAALLQENTTKDLNACQTNVPVQRKASGWCPKIYFNTKCYSGPLLSKWRLRNLPKSIGPGSVVSVMTTVLTKLITSAYKSSRVLRELQLESTPAPNMHQQILKTKYNMKIYSATVEICTSASQVEQFCRDICRRLVCCPNLISTHSHPSTCPDNCLKIAKSKHYFHFGERKQIGRPRGGHSNIEQITSEEQNSGCRRKKKHKKKLLLTIRKKHGPGGAVTRSGTSDAEIGNVETVTNSHQDGTKISGEDYLKVEETPCFTPKPCESLKKLKIICNQQKLDGNKSYVVLRDTNEIVPQEKHSSVMKRKHEKDDSRKCKKSKEVVKKKYEVQTRGISLTKNYSFEKKTHKKIFIIPPKPPTIISDTPPDTQKEQEPIPKQETSTTLNSEKILPKYSRDPPEFSSNPAEWSVQQVTDFIKNSDCYKLSKIIRDQEIDGTSLMLLTLPTVQEFIEPKLGPAVKLCDLIERLKHVFFSRYANAITV